LVKGHKIAKDLGFEYSVVLGDDKYYPRVGYIPAEDYGIKAPFEMPSVNFMAFKIQENATPAEGIVRYADKFGIN